MHSKLFLDIGNTNTKWRYQGKYFVIPTEEFNYDKLQKSSVIWASSVAPHSLDLKKNHVNFVQSQHKYKSLVNTYKEPHNLGSDRWLGMIACYEKSMDRSFILLDIGSAITIDIVNKRGIYQGGLIYPGLEKIRLIFDNFPVAYYENINAIGQSTEECWSIGTLSLIVNEINQKIIEFHRQFPDAEIYTTGGGYSNIQKFLNFPNNYYENLVLDGLELFVNNMG